MEVLKNRFILLVGKIFISSDDPTNTELVLVCSDSEESTVKVLNNSFEMKKKLVTVVSYARGAE